MRSLTTAAALLAALLLQGAACSSSPSGGSDDDDDSSAADAGPSTEPDAGPSTEPDAASGEASFARCTGATFTPEPAGEWLNGASAFNAATGSPSHTAQDLIVPTGTAPSLRGYFSYGLILKELKQDEVKAWVWDCSSWVALGAAITGDDGYATFTAPGDLPVGAYDVVFEVTGDASTTAATLWVLPPGTHLVVSDIDGTLTTSDTELFLQILNGDYVPEAYPSAVELTATHAQIGHIVVYLTGRPNPLLGKTREWLSTLGFAPGPLHVTDSFLDALPTDAQVGAYKEAYLTSLSDAGFVLDMAYGNATTDITAYLGAGLPPSLVWIIGPNAGQEETNAVTDTWAGRVTEVELLPIVDQPFAW
jgi:LNS2-like protein (lipin/Ned1/Smp2)